LTIATAFPVAEHAMPVGTMARSVVDELAGVREDPALDDRNLFDVRRAVMAPEDIGIHVRAVQAHFRVERRSPEPVRCCGRARSRRTRAGRTRRSSGFRQSGCPCSPARRWAPKRAGRSSPLKHAITFQPELLTRCTRPGGQPALKRELDIDRARRFRRASRERLHRDVRNVGRSLSQRSRSLVARSAMKLL